MPSGKLCWAGGRYDNTHDGDTRSLFKVEMLPLPEEPQPHAAVTITFKLTYFDSSAATWRPIPWDALYPQHHRRMHVIAVASDVSTYSHVHPQDLFTAGATTPSQLPGGTEAADSNGLLSVELTFPAPDTYMLIVDVMIDSTALDVCVSEHSKHEHAPVAGSDHVYLELSTRHFVSVAGTVPQRHRKYDARPWSTVHSVLTTDVDKYTAPVKFATLKEECCRLPPHASVPDQECYRVNFAFYALELGDNVGSFTRRLLPAGSPLPTDVCLHMEVTVERAGSGTPVTDLDMYLGAAAHILVVNNDMTSAEHLHGSFGVGVSDMHFYHVSQCMHPMFGVHQQQRGSTVGAMVRFDSSADGLHDLLVTLKHANHLVIAKTTLLVGSAHIAPEQQLSAAAARCDRFPAPNATAPTQQQGHGEGEEGGVGSEFAALAALDWELDDSPFFQVDDQGYITVPRERLGHCLDMVPPGVIWGLSDAAALREPCIRKALYDAMLAEPRLQPYLCLAGHLLNHNDIDDCHMTAHALGAAAFRSITAATQQAVDLEAALAATVVRCGDLCAHGCVHAAVAAYIARLPEREHVRIARACDGLSGASASLRYACVHGIGHGLLSLGMAVPQALAVCGSLPPTDVSVCQDGLIMENWFHHANDVMSSLTSSSSNSYNNTALQAVCKDFELSESLASRCAAAIGEGVAIANGHNLAGARAACARLKVDFMDDGAVWACNEGATNEMGNVQVERRTPPSTEVCKVDMVLDWSPRSAADMQTPGEGGEGDDHEADDDDTGSEQQDTGSSGGNTNHCAGDEHGWQLCGAPALLGPGTGTPDPDHTIVLHANLIDKCIRLYHGAPRAACVAVVLAGMLRGPGVPPSLLRPLLCAGSQLLTDGIVTDCHEIAHALGVASFRQRLALVRGTASPTAALAVLQTTVAACGAVCLYGCVHGAIAAYVGAFVAKAAVEEDAALSAIFEYCHTTFAEGAHGRDLYACIHGIGHGLALLPDVRTSWSSTGYRTVAAACKAGSGVGQFQLERGCVGGAFMQHWHWLVLMKEASRGITEAHQLLLARSGLQAATEAQAAADEAVATVQLCGATRCNEERSIAGIGTNVAGTVAWGTPAEAAGHMCGFLDATAGSADSVAWTLCVVAVGEGLAMAFAPDSYAAQVGCSDAFPTSPHDAATCRAETKELLRAVQAEAVAAYPGTCASHVLVKGVPHQSEQWTASSGDGSAAGHTAVSVGPPSPASDASTGGSSSGRMAAITLSVVAVAGFALLGLCVVRRGRRMQRRSAYEAVDAQASVVQMPAASEEEEEEAVEEEEEGLQVDDSDGSADDDDTKMV